jgi:adenosine deaminase
LRSTPKRLGDRSKADYIEAIYQVIEKAQTDFPRIKVRYLMSINRGAGVDAAKEALELAATRNKYLIGIELSGDSRVSSFADFRPIFDRARNELGLKVTLHCACCEEQVHESEMMIDFKPDRLGHCCFLVSRLRANNYRQKSK